MKPCQATNRRIYLFLTRPGIREIYKEIQDNSAFTSDIHESKASL